MLKTPEQVQKFVQSLPNPEECSPDEYFEKFQEGLLDAEVPQSYHGLLDQIEGESWRWTEKGLSSWVSFLRKYQLMLEKAAPELVFLYKIYDMLTDQLLTKKEGKAKE